jgi:hypothetical protein
VLSGSWPGEIWFFRRQPDGKFAAGKQLKDRNGKPLNAGSGSSVFAVDWDGDGRLDILLGDRCGGFQSKPSQTEQEKSEERRANDQLPSLRRKWAETFRHYRQLDDEPASPQRDMLREQLRRLKEEMVVVQEIQERYRPAYQSHGFVWLFLRKPAVKPAVRKGP